MRLLSRSRIRPDLAELARLQQSYRRRQAVWITAILVWGAMGFGAFFAFGEKVPSWYLGALGGVWLVCAAVGLGVWRCPRCGEQLGRTWSEPACSHCFVELESRQPTS